MTVIADVIVKVPGCYGVDPDSWAWWLHMCWLFTSSANALAAGLSLTAALLIARGYRALLGGR